MNILYIKHSINWAAAQGCCSAAAAAAAAAF